MAREMVEVVLYENGEYEVKGANPHNAACNTDNRTLCKCVSEDIKERIEYYERKDRENQEEQDKAEDVSEEEIVKNISKEEAKKLMWDDVRDLGYKEGLEKAWKAARRIVLIPKNGGLSANELHELFDSHLEWYDIFQRYTAYDVIEVLDKYDERNEIHVGDEVKIINTEESFVVTQILPTNIICGIDADGSVFSPKKEQLKKTGNHFAEVGKILEKLRGGEA